MTYTLEALATDCRTALKADAGPGSRVRIREHLQQALTDETFLAAHVGPDATKERDVIYEDPDLSFCICIHIYAAPKEGSPHDHGPTWAIYGQAEGETEMTDWRIVEPASNGKAAKVEMVKSYHLKPGDAHVYEIGDVHAPLRAGPTKLVRIEGQNTDKIKRTPIEAVE